MLRRRRVDEKASTLFLSSFLTPTQAYDQNPTKIHVEIANSIPAHSFQYLTSYKYVYNCQYPCNHHDPRLYPSPSHRTLNHRSDNRHGPRPPRHELKEAKTNSRVSAITRVRFLPQLVQSSRSKANKPQQLLTFRLSPPPNHEPRHHKPDRPNLISPSA